jgi:tRNA(Ser,Leu) C12 N-acetylase TAN1
MSELKIMKSIHIEGIKNGCTIETHDNHKIVFCQDKIEAIKTLADIMNVEIGVEIKNKEIKNE